MAAGLVLLGIGGYMTASGLADPVSRNPGLFVLMVSTVLVPGGLLTAPWSRIRPRGLWYVLFTLFVLWIPLGAWVIYLLNTWSAIHGAGGAGTALVAFLLATWASQLPAIWRLRPGEATAETSATARARELRERT